MELKRHTSQATSKSRESSNQEVQPDGSIHVKTTRTDEETGEDVEVVLVIPANQVALSQVSAQGGIGTMACYGGAGALVEP
jgi:hypothetical protein